MSVPAVEVRARLSALGPDRTGWADELRNTLGAKVRGEGRKAPINLPVATQANDYLIAPGLTVIKI